MALNHKPASNKRPKSVRYQHSFGRGTDANNNEDGDDDENTSPASTNPNYNGEGHPIVVRRRVKIEYIQDKSRRHVTFSKRKSGIMKKVNEGV